MSCELGTWLRQQRQARGWPIPDMARRLRDAAKDIGDRTVPGNDAMCRNIRRWERGIGGISERHALHYCKALGIPPERFGPSRPPNQPREAATSTAGTSAATLAAPASPVPRPGYPVRDLTSGPRGPGLPPPHGVAYRWTQEPEMGDSTVEREVLMAAHEGSEHAEQAEQRGIGEATLEQMRADVIRLSHEYMTGEPLPLFLEMRRVRGRMLSALDRRLWPRDATQLYFLVGCINCLMANAASDLDSPWAAEELARAGWAYAVAIDHRPLMAQLRLSLTDIAYWHDQARQARELAASGLEYLADGPTAAQLHLKYGRASARLGDADAAHSAVASANEARERQHHDELLEMGGEFSLSRASQHSLAGSALIEIPGAEDEAAGELEHATELYAAGPEPGESHRYTLEARARIDLGTARLRANQLDAAVVAVEPVLSLPVAKRTLELPKRLSVVRAELSQPRYQGSPQARDLDERIEEFSRETITTELGSLPAGPG
jgi:transcriptional regulator with XRE-family HTH domain